MNVKTLTVRIYINFLLTTTKPTQRSSKAKGLNQAS